MRAMRAHLVFSLLCLILSSEVGVVEGSHGDNVAVPGMSGEADSTFLRDYAETRGFLLGRPVGIKPAPDGKAVLFLRSQPREPVLSLFETNVETGETRLLLSPDSLLKGREEEISVEERARRERMRISTGGFSSFQLSDDGRLILVTLSGRMYILRRETGEIEELEVAKGMILDPRFSPDGRYVSYVRDYDLRVFDLDSRVEHAVTEGGTEQLSHGLSEFVAQEEMGRMEGYWWSPDSKLMAFEEADVSEVEVFHIADPLHPERPAASFPYPRAGGRNATVRLGVVPAAGGGKTWVKWDRARYPYLAKVVWEKNSPLTILVQTRDQTEELLLAVDPATGETRELLREEDPAWLNIDGSVPKWLSGGSGFLWTTERRGGWEVELRDADGSLKRVLTPKEVGYVSLLTVDEKRRIVYFLAAPNPTEVQAYRVGLDGEAAERITAEAGLHNLVFSKDHSIYVDTYSTLSTMPRSYVCRSGGTLLGELPSEAEDPPFIPKTELLSVKGERVFYASVTRPRTFDPEKHYPVIVDVYGGPHVNVIQATMSRYLMDQWIADQGFVVVSGDGRGTPRRGRDFERSIKGSFGRIPLEDQVQILELLGNRFPELDLNRVGIFGWSFGGYLSALAVLKRPDVFRAAAAGAPVVDFRDYDTHYTERYLGLPSENREGYDETSLLTYAGGLDRPLLVIHGTADDNVYFFHTLKLVDALFRAGKDFELLPLAGFTHMVPDALVRERMNLKIVEFLNRSLRTGDRGGG